MGSISRRMALLATVAVASFAVTTAFAEGLPPLKQKATYKVGFAQTEMNNPWRLAQTQSMKDEAAKLGWQLVYTDAAGSAAKQVADVNSMIAQGGEDYVTFIGSDFVKEGTQAGEWLAKTTGGKGIILEIEGSTGSSPANDRKKGFDDVIAQNPGLKIVASQTGNFNRDEGRKTAE